jgi:hypothetical protein
MYARVAPFKCMSEHVSFVLLEQEGGVVEWKARRGMGYLRTAFIPLITLL